MQLQIIIIVVLASVVGFVTYALVKSLVLPHKTEAIEKLIRQGKLSAAIKLAKSIIAKNTHDYHAHYFLGQAYLQDNKPELALMEFKMVNQHAIFDKTIPEVPFRKMIAQLYVKFNQHEEALKEYLLLTKLEPANADNFYQTGKFFEERDKSDQAFNYYKQAIKIDKRHVKAHAGLGLLLFRAKQFPEAKKAIDLAITLSPNTFSSYYYLGKILKESKDYAGAVNAFEKSLRDPEYKQRALLERGSCYMAANSVEKAIPEFERAVKASQNDAAQETLYARYFLAACYEKQRKIDAAIAEWEKIYAKNRNFRDVPAKLAEYRNIQSNDNMKEYLTCSMEGFMELCKKVALKAFNRSPKDCQPTKYGCRILATEANSDNWMGVRQQIHLLVFYRENDLIEDGFLRGLLEEMKKQNITDAVICTSSGFTRPAMEFAENRPLDLEPKEKLEEILNKAV